MRFAATLTALLLVSRLFSQAATFTLNDATFEKGDILRREVIYGIDGYKGPRPESYPFLDSLVLFIKSHPGLVLELGMHMDQRGSDVYNQKITASRAAQVLMWFTERGVSPDQLVDSGYGETKPIYTQAMIDKDTSKAKRENMYRANRRTEFKILRAPDCLFSFDETAFAYGCVFRTSRIKWQLGKAGLHEDSKPLLDSIAAFLLKNPRQVFEVGCHTDSRGSEQPNQKLSYARAYSIADYLYKKGVPTLNLHVKGYGETDPILFPKQIARRPPAEIEDGHWRNRRMELRFLYSFPSAYPVVSTALRLTDTALTAGASLISRNISFTLNKDSLLPQSYPFLDSVVDFMKRNPGVVLEVGCHADARASNKYSTNLTQRRAQSLVNYLVSKGIARERVVPKGYFNTKPAKLSDGTVLTEKYILTKPSKEEQEYYHMLNRRSEFKILAINTPPLPFTIENARTNGRIVTYSMRFPLNKDSLLPESYPFLDSLFAFMQSNPDVIMEIGVHLDARTNPHSHLAMNRAAEIADYLITKGIRRDRLLAKGYGEVAPLRLPDGTVLTEKYIAAQPADKQEALHALNRRVEFRIVAMRAHATIPYSRTSDTFTLSDTIFAEGSALVLNGILYDLNKAPLRPEAYVHLDSVAAFLLKYPYLDVEIAVHTDSRASDAYSFKLSQARAQTVVDYLVSKGVAKERIVAKGYEDSQPRRLPDGTALTEKYIQSKPDKQEQEALHQMNRRTELRIVRVH